MKSVPNEMIKETSVNADMKTQFISKYSVFEWQLIKNIEIQNRYILKNDVKSKLGQSGGKNDDNDEDSEIINANSGSSSSSSSSDELSKSVESIDYNLDSETHFSAIYDI